MVAYYAHILCWHPLLSIVDCTHVGPAAAYFMDLVTLHRRTLPAKQPALVEDSYSLLWI